MTNRAGAHRAGDLTVSAVRSVAIQAATAAGEHARGSFRSAVPVEAVQPHDLKLSLDRACEAIIVASIRESFPFHGILSEEMGYAPGAEPYVWIADPLDGTVNFFHGIPFFCTCVSCHAIEEGNDSGGRFSLPDGKALGGVVAAAIYVPLERELFVAAPHGGAFMNGTRLRIAPLSSLSEAIVSLSFSARDGSTGYISRLLPVMIERAQKVRSLGSTALDIVNVAAGRTGAFVQWGTNLWDFAAAAAILAEAGGVVDAHEIAPGRFHIIASNPGLISEIRQVATA